MVRARRRPDARNVVEVSAEGLNAHVEDLRVLLILKIGDYTDGLHVYREVTEVAVNGFLDVKIPVESTLPMGQHVVFVVRGTDEVIAAGTVRQQW
jgi:hypothetical protein